MPNVDFFTRLGLFVMKGFFAAAECQRLRSEMRGGANPQATVFTQGSYVVDEALRKVKRAQVPAATVSFVRERLLAIKPAVESHFQRSLEGCEEPQLLIYHPGDFYCPHKDSVSDPKYSVSIQKRQISAVIFLNSEVGEADLASYSGGSLVLYGLMADSRLRRVGFPVRSETGMLIAFPSDTWHEVTTVTHGERLSIAG